MKIGVLVPVIVDVWNQPLRDAAVGHLPPDIELDIRNLEYGVPSMQSDFDVAISGPHILEMALRMQADGCDGLVVFCFKDPVVGAVKEKLTIPVVGLRESAVALAGLLGDSIAVITTNYHSAPSYRRALGNKVKYVTDLDTNVLDLVHHEQAEAALRKRMHVIREKECDVVVLGCGSILGLDFSGIEEEFGVPIVIPFHAAVHACSYFARLGLKQSRVAFPVPEEKEIRQSVAGS